MDCAQKKVIVGVIAVLISGIAIGFFVFNLKKGDTKSVSTESIFTENDSVADPNLQEKEVKQKIDDFSDGIEATEYEDNSYSFDTELGQTSISTTIPIDFPEDAPKLNAEIVSAARSDSKENRTMFTIFWQSNDSYDDLKKYLDEIAADGWIIISEDVFEDSEYIRFEKDGRRLDFSLAQTEDEKREVMVMVEE